MVVITIMETIYKFCKNADYIRINNSNIDDILNSNIPIDIKTNEITRSIDSSIDMTTIFHFPLNIKFDDTVRTEIDYMKTIELFYPSLFSWRFNGKHIECLGNILINNDDLGRFTRYNGVYGFIKSLGTRLIQVLKYRKHFDIYLKPETINTLISTGSINSMTDLYAIDINPDYPYDKILNFSKNRILTDVSIKTLDMKFWVREINPDFFKEYKENDTPKLELTQDSFASYPQCIKNIASLSKKGNHNRFLLATFLLKVHIQRDAKHQLDMMLSDDERNHMNTGNCKDQWRAILIKNYPCPSCRTMAIAGFCDHDCGKMSPKDIVEPRTCG